jgi:hypothetical protein
VPRPNVCSDGRRAREEAIAAAAESLIAFGLV